MSHKENSDGKMVNNVNVKQCFSTIFFCIIMPLLALVPFTFGSAGLHLSYEYFPVIGNGLIIEYTAIISSSITFLSNLDPSLVNIINLGLKYFTIAFFAVLLADIAMSIILAILRLNILRFLFKVVSIILGFAMIIISFICTLAIVGIVMNFISGGGIGNILLFVESSGILFILALNIFSPFIAKRQFRWFAKLW